jgi:alpha-galactosidase
MTLHTWTLSNQIVERVLVFDSDVGLYTSHFVNRGSGVDLIAQGNQQQRWTPEFDFKLDGTRITSLDADWNLHEVNGAFPEASFVPANFTPLVLHLQHRIREIDVIVCYYCTNSGTRKSYWVQNRSAHTVTLTHAVIETLPAEIGAPGELILDAHYGALPRETFFTGRVDDCAIVISNPRTGNQIIALNEASGHMKRIESGAWFWDGMLRIMYDTDLFPLEINIPPQSGWCTAAAQIVLIAGHDGFANARWVTPAITRPMLRKTDYRAAWHYNTWDPFGPQINESVVKQLIPIAAQMGFEIFTIDDGWQARYGDNAVSDTRFPSGLDDICHAVESNGMRLGLWASLAVLDRDLANSSEFTALQCRDAQGKIKSTMTAIGEQTVMCLASDYADSAARRLISLIERYRLAYIKLDLTTMFNAYGEAPGCHAIGHHHATADESISQIYAAIKQITDQVYQKLPHVLIDLTFELWGQKHTIDYGLLQAADVSWLSNVGDNSDKGAGPRQARTLLYHRALAIPVETMLIGNLRAELGDMREKFATAIGSCPLLLGDLRKLSAGQIKWFSNNIRWYRRLRDEVNFTDSFFPFGKWQQPSVVDWDGFARLSRTGEGLIVLFRNESAINRVKIHIPLETSQSYTLREVESDTSINVNAADLRNGLTLEFGEQKVLIFEARLCESV